LRKNFIDIRQPSYAAKLNLTRRPSPVFNSTQLNSIYWYMEAVKLDWTNTEHIIKHKA